MKNNSLTKLYDELFIEISKLKTWENLNDFTMALVHTAGITISEDTRTAVLLVAKIIVKQLCKGDTTDIDIVLGRITNEWETVIKPIFLEYEEQQDGE